MAAPERDPRTPKARPNPGPMQILLGFGGLVATTAIATAMVRPQATPPPAAEPLSSGPTGPAPTPLVVRHVTRYVQLTPGETAPPGAKVVQAPDPSPRVVVVTIPAPTPRPVVVVTRQSGTK